MDMPAGGQEAADYEQVNYPSTSVSSIDLTDIRNQQTYQQNDVPLQLSDILPIDRRSYDKMEPPKKEGQLIKQRIFV